MYVTPVQIDPERPALPISHPSYYAIYLAKLMGRFATLGMAEDTWALNEGVIDEQAFLEQTWLTHAEREAMFLNALDRTSRGVVACVFDATDRVQHMFYRHGSAGVIEDLYRRADALVGKTLPHVDDRTVLFVLSDHGFASFRRGVNLNTWLHRNGYLALKDNAAESGPYFEGVDWTRTRGLRARPERALSQREGQGIGGHRRNARKPDALAQEMAGKLSNLRDEEHGRHGDPAGLRHQLSLPGPVSRIRARPHHRIQRWLSHFVGCRHRQGRRARHRGQHEGVERRSLDRSTAGAGRAFFESRHRRARIRESKISPRPRSIYSASPQPEWMEGKPVFAIGLTAGACSSQPSWPPVAAAAPATFQKADRAGHRWHGSGFLERHWSVAPEPRPSAPRRRFQTPGHHHPAAKSRWPGPPSSPASTPAATASSISCIAIPPPWRPSPP